MEDRRPKTEERRGKMGDGKKEKRRGKLEDRRRRREGGRKEGGDWADLLRIKLNVNSVIIQC